MTAPYPESSMTWILEAEAVSHEVSERVWRLRSSAAHRLHRVGYLAGSGCCETGANRDP